jgi:hypothetical protein
MMAIMYPIYFGFAMKNNNPFNFGNDTNSSSIIKNEVFSNNRGFALLMLTIVVALFMIWDLVIKKYVADKVSCGGLSSTFEKYPLLVKFRPWIVIALVTIACVAYLVYDLKDYYNLVSLLGLFVFISICVFISEHPSRINTRALAVGILMQYILGVFILRSELGYCLFQWLGNQVTTFLDYTDAGCSLVFGVNFKDHFFAFKAMPVVIFFSAIVNILYYYGAIQFILLKIAWAVNFLMGTSPTESVNSVANVFLGPSEAPLLISNDSKSTVFQIYQSNLIAIKLNEFRRTVFVENDRERAFRCHGGRVFHSLRLRIGCLHWFWSSGRSLVDSGSYERTSFTCYSQDPVPRDEEDQRYVGRDKDRENKVCFCHFYQIINRTSRFQIRFISLI